MLFNPPPFDNSLYLLSLIPSGESTSSRRLTKAERSQRRRNIAGIMSLVLAIASVPIFKSVTWFEADRYNWPYGWVPWCRDHPRWTADLAISLAWAMMVLGVMVFAVLAHHETRVPLRSRNNRLQQEK